MSKRNDDFGRDQFGRDHRDIDRAYSPSRKRRRSMSPPSAGYGSDPYGNRGGGMYHQQQNHHYQDNSSYQVYINPTQPGLLPDPAKLDFQVSFKHFAEFCRRQRDTDDEDIQRRFTQYRDDFRMRTISMFFDAHKAEEWFLERYDPDISKKRIAHINGRKKELLAYFLADLETGKFDNVNFDDLDPVVHTKEKAENQDEFSYELSKTTAELNLGHKNNMTKLINESNSPHVLFIKIISNEIKRAQMTEEMFKIPGLKYFELSDPNPGRSMNRMGWLIFESKESAHECFVKSQAERVQVNGFNFSILVPNHPDYKIKSVPFECGNIDRLRVDQLQIKDLANGLDKEAGFEGCSALEKRIDLLKEIAVVPAIAGVTEVEEEEVEQTSLDEDLILSTKEVEYFLLIATRVHLYDYYSAYECDSLESFTKRGGVSFRPASREGSNNAEKYFASHDLKISFRLKRPMEGPEVELMGGKNIEAETELMISRLCFNVAVSKYRCEVCAKLFKGDDFVKKHVRKKHPEKIDQTVIELKLFNAYVCDPNRPSNPVENRAAFIQAEQRKAEDHRGRSMAMPLPDAMRGGDPYGRRRGPRYDGDSWPQQQNDRRRNDHGTPRGNDHRYSNASDGGSARSTRTICSYVDLDAPADTEMELNYD